MKVWIARSIQWILVIALYSCNANNGSEGIDPVLTGNSTCGPPCWAGIIPGVTSADQTVAILQQQEADGSGELVVLPTNISWRASNGQRFYISVNDSDIVTTIDIILSATKLEGVINLFGDPEYVRSGEIDEGWYSAYVYYPQKGLAFRVAGKKVEISPNMQVGRAYFFAPTKDILTMLAAIHGKDRAAAYSPGIQTWTGYGVIIP